MNGHPGACTALKPGFNGELYLLSVLYEKRKNITEKVEETHAQSAMLTHYKLFLFFYSLLFFEYQYTAVFQQPYHPIFQDNPDVK